MGIKALTPAMAAAGFVPPGLAGPAATSATTPPPAAPPEAPEELVVLSVHLLGVEAVAAGCVLGGGAAEGAPEPPWRRACGQGESREL